MSEELTINDKLAIVQKRILTTVFFLCLGWAVLWIGVGLLGINNPLPVISVVIAPLPMLLRMWRSGFGAMFQIPDYVVITTHGDGRRTSDGGAEAASINLFLRLLKIFIGIVIGFIATMVYLVILLIHYTALFVQAKPKPKFLKSAYMIYIIGAIVLLLALVGNGIANNIRRSVTASTTMRVHSVLIDAIKDADRQNVPAYIVTTESYRGQPLADRRAPMTVLDETAQHGFFVVDIIHGSAVMIVAPYDGRGVVTIKYGDNIGTVRIERLSLDPPQ